MKFKTFLYIQISFSSTSPAARSVNAACAVVNEMDEGLGGAGG